MSRPADPNARAALISAARKEFWRHGIQKARIEDITASSGLSKGAFYLHFESKEALFRELVAQLSEGMDRLLENRMREEEAFFGPTGSKKRVWQTSSARMTELKNLSRGKDIEVLELLWAQRDVAQVLLEGAQGTEFAGVIWAMVDREVKRVSESFDRLKQWGVCRDDVPSDTMGSMLIGSWLLLLRRMTTLSEKPDLDSWLDELTRLLENGIWARPPAAPVRKNRSPPRRKSISRNRLRSLP